ncbi:MAG: hypothetical protein MN733_34535 [Nitrososphaera sp.]|nr:hypothetical protein [Nitrososphaera sp.]
MKQPEYLYRVEVFDKDKQEWEILKDWNGRGVLTMPLYLAEAFLTHYSKMYPNCRYVLHSKEK